MTRVATPIYDHVYSKHFKSTLIFIHLYQRTKNLTTSFICSGDIVDNPAI